MSQPVVHVLTQGNLANQMVQYMVATRLAGLVPGCRVSNVRLPEWSIEHPVLPSTGGPELLVEGQYVDIEGLSEQLRSGAIERVNLLAFGQWLQCFPDKEDVSRLYPTDQSRFPGYGPDHLVCNIRGGEVLDGRHPHYTLVPPAFYEEMQARTGLHLVFMGQIEENSYCHALRALFPTATFRSSEGAIADFQTFRNSARVVPAISTFSWLAAWLSHAEQIILPVSGLFHPVQMPEVDLLPLTDPRYEFHLFPINFSSAVGRFEQAHRAIDGRWRRMTAEAIGQLRGRHRGKAGIKDLSRLFDEAFYLQTYKDIAAAVARGDLVNGRQHFESNGYAERRRAFAFDRRWYASTYPMAAFEVGQGDYASLIDHYSIIGSLRGYRAVAR